MLDALVTSVWQREMQAKIGKSDLDKYKGLMQTDQRLTVNSSATYVLRIQGYLDESWSDFMGGATIRSESRPNQPQVTEVTGEFQDQAALAGALSLLYDLGLPLLSVECLAIRSKNRP